MRLVLFDIDGTLLRTNGAGTRALASAMAEVCGVEDGMRGILPDGKTDSQIVREALRRNGAKPMLEGAALRRFYRIYENHLKHEIDRDSGMQVFCGAYRLAQRLAVDDRFRVGVATGNIRGGAKMKLRHAGIERFFAFGGYGCDAEERSEMIRAAIRRGGIASPLGVTVIGDTPADVLHGRRVGARTVAVATGSYSLEELKTASPDLAVPSLDPDDRIMGLLAQ